MMKGSVPVQQLYMEKPLQEMVMCAAGAKAEDHRCRDLHTDAGHSDDQSGAPAAFHRLLAAPNRVQGHQQ